MEVKNIHFAYGAGRGQVGHPVLNGVSFKVQPGKVTTLIGANGCGKTTLFNVMTKNCIPQQGQVLLNGQDISKKSVCGTLPSRWPLYISIIQRLPI